MENINSNRDVIILGGGPAGLAAGIALRQKGIDALVVEALQPAIDKGCGEGLMPDALASLRELGINAAESDGYPFRGIRFVNTAHQVNADFPTGPGIGLRRTRLHQLIANRAQQVGVELLWGVRPKLLDERSIEVGGRKLNFRWLIGADGQASRVRKWAGLESVRKESLRFGFRRHYRVTPWSDYMEVHWGEPGQVYITPVGPETLCVTFITRDPMLAHKGFLESFPAIAHNLKDAPVISQPRGAVSATRKLRRVAARNIALIGDASGSADAITGEGLALSFRQSIALAAALQSGCLKDYEKAHAKIGRLPHAMGRLLLTMDRWPRMERRAMAALSSRPIFFDQLLSVHVGAEKLSRFALRRGPQFGWSLLCASLG